MVKPNIGKSIASTYPPTTSCKVSKEVSFVKDKRALRPNTSIATAFTSSDIMPPIVVRLTYLFCHALISLDNHG